jgi:hypothetical protein
MSPRRQDRDQRATPQPGTAAGVGRRGMVGVLGDERLREFNRGAARHDPGIAHRYASLVAGSSDPDEFGSTGSSAAVQTRSRSGPSLPPSRPGAAGRPQNVAWSSESTGRARVLHQRRLELWSSGCGSTVPTTSLPASVPDTRRQRWWATRAGLRATTSNETVNTSGERPTGRDPTP